MIRGRRGTAVGVVTLLLAVAGCASSGSEPPATPHHGVTTGGSGYAEPTDPPAAPENPCPDPRVGALSVFNTDGSTRWSIDFPVGDSGDGGPVADRGLIFSSNAGSVSAVRAADGSIVWDKPLGRSVFTLWLDSGLLIANVDQVFEHAQLVGLDPDTGETRWTHAVPGGFLGDGVLTGDGGLAIREAGTGMLSVIDTSTGDVRWSRDLHDSRSSDDLPSAAPGLITYVDAERQLYGLNAHTGAVEWQVSTGHTGQVMISGDVGVVAPDSYADPTVTVFAHSLSDGTEVWRRELADLSSVYSVAGGFLLYDYRADTVTFVRGADGTPVWRAHFGRVAIDQPPIELPAAGLIGLFEENAVAFVDRDNGKVRNEVAAEGGYARASADGDAIYLGAGTEVVRMTAAGVSWRAGLQHFTQVPPLLLDDGGIAVQSQDPMCAVG